MSDVFYQSDSSDRIDIVDRTETFERLEDL